jgi:predicted transglutaminase-like cysteine proteinase
MGCCLLSASSWAERSLISNTYLPDKQLVAVNSQHISWQKILRDNQHLTEFDKVRTVNEFFNTLNFIQDDTNNHWSTPLETVLRNGGDCEDLVIAKYFTLRASGIDPSKLRIAHMRAPGRKLDHMVLLYRPDGNSKNAIILDNLTNYTGPLSKRTDLKLVFSFNEEAIWVKDRLGKTRKTSVMGLKKWTNLQHRVSQQHLLKRQG